MGYSIHHYYYGLDGFVVVLLIIIPCPSIPHFPITSHIPPHTSTPSRLCDRGSYNSATVASGLDLKPVLLLDLAFAVVGGAVWSRWYER